MARADAWASPSLGGLGGFCWIDNTLKWFHIAVTLESLPVEWHVVDLSLAIAALECLAQAALLVLRFKIVAVPFQQELVVHQQCDNMPSVGAASKMLSTKPPLSLALQVLASNCMAHKCTARLTHIAGARNEWADAASRLNMPVQAPPLPSDFSAVNKEHIELDDVLAPWRQIMAISNPASSQC